MKKDDFTLLDTVYKDETPVSTVEKIQAILASHGIKAKEAQWTESGVEHCYSLRLVVEGTSFGVNGKGVTKEFARASAYGELMERMQLGLLGDSSVQKLGYYDAVIGIDEQLSSEQLYNELPSWYDYLASRLKEIDGSEMDGRELLNQYANDEGKLTATRFYNMMTKEVVHIPREIRCLSCGSNGGAAGNTMEEAIVQAISEIMERYNKQKAISECISLPDIPEVALVKYKTAYEIISNLRAGGLKVVVKDCSLGGKFPVVCVCYIDESTGKYHSHFGAYPIFEIALERTLTETFQGRHLKNFPSNEDFIYNRNNVHSYRSIYNELKSGNFDKTLDFFVGEQKYSYNEKVGFKGENNKELLKELVEYLASLGKEILVRDGSSLGFPTYNVVIPGYSEVAIHGLSKKNSGFVNAKAAVKVLRNLSEASFEDYMLLMMHINEMKKLAGVLERLFSFATCANLPLACTKEEDSFLMFSSIAYVYYGLGNLSQALAFVEKLVRLVNKEDLSYIICLKRYLAMTLNGDENGKIKNLLEMFHGKQTVSELFLHIENGTNPLDRFVLHCDEKSCGSCIAKAFCRHVYTKSLISVIHEGAKSLNFEEFVQKISEYSKNK